MGNDSFYTDGGCLRPKGPSGWGVYHSEERDGVTKEHKLFGSILVGTNNSAEMTAAMKAIEYATELGLSKITLITDSKYVLNGATKWHLAWVKRNWVRADDTEVPNKELWRLLLAAIDKFGGKIKWKWVKGHSGIAGNEQADTLASRGNTLASSGIEDEFRDIQDSSKGSKGSAKVPKAKYNRMLSNSRLYFNSQEKGRITECGRHVYYTGAHGKDEADVGRRAADCIHSVIFLADADPVLDTVRRLHQGANDGELETLAIGRADVILTSGMYHELSDPKGYTFQKTKSVPGIKHIDGAVISYDHTPPIQGFVHLNDLAALERILANYVKGAKGILSTDITDILYDSSTKGKGKTERTVRKLKPDYGTILKSFEVDVNAPTGGMQRLVISMGHVAPTRNTLSAMGDKAPKVSVITWPEGNRAFRYGIIIEADKDIGIWTAMHANLKFTQ